MSATVCLRAIRHNAATIAERARLGGLPVTVALKAPFVVPDIVNAVRPGGASAVSVSSVSALPRLPGISRADKQFIGLSLPQDAEAIAHHCESSLHTNPYTVMAMGQAAARQDESHGIWLGMRTNDDREGLMATEICSTAAFALVREAPLYLKGLMANWGCNVQAPPPREEILAVFTVAQRLTEHLGLSPLTVSIGGSVLLPIIESIAKPRLPLQIRVGEAILSGTIPGDDGGRFDLRRPFTLRAEIVEARRVRTPTGVVARVLLNQGSLAFSAADARIVGHAGRLLSSSCELTIAEIAIEEHLPPIGKTIEIALGFQSAMRVLMNDSVVKIFEEPKDSLEGECLPGVLIGHERAEEDPGL